MDGIRLVAIAEPIAGEGSTGNAEPAGAGRAVVATGDEIRRRTGSGSSHGSAAPSGVGPSVLDRVMAARLDRVGAPVRWGVGAGDDDAAATTRAALALRSARERGIPLGFVTGDPWRDALLADLALALAALLDDLTPRQAEIAGLVLVDGARQAEVAVALRVSRATISVAVARGRFPAIAGARRAIEALLAGPPVGGSEKGGGGASAARSR